MEPTPDPVAHEGADAAPAQAGLAQVIAPQLAGPPEPDPAADDSAAGGYADRPEDSADRRLVTPGEYMAAMNDHAEFLKARRGQNEHLRASFRGCVFEGIDLTARKSVGSVAHVDFREARFRQCVFGALDLAEADFSGASLVGANLAGTRNLTEYRLGASDLRYAKVSIEKFVGLDALREQCGRAEKTLYVLLATCAVLIAIALSVRGVTLFRADSSLELPTVGIAVPVVLYYRMVPWLLLVLYSVFLSSLTKVWRTLRDLPAVLPNGRFVHREVLSYPSFPLLSVGLWEQLRGGRQESRLERTFVAATSLGLVPCTLALIFVTYLSRHDAATTASHGAALLLSLAGSMTGYGRMKAHLLRGFEQPRPPVRRRLLLPFTRVYGWASVTHWINEERPRDASDGKPRGNDGDRGPRLRLAGIAVVCTAVGVMLSGGARVAMVSPGCGREAYRLDEDPLVCHIFAISARDARLDSMQLHGGNLRRAYLPGATLTGADLEGAVAEGVYLQGAVLDRAILKGTMLGGAVLWEARMDSAVLKEADLTGADLRGALLPRARLQGAMLKGADLTGANLRGAIVCGAHVGVPADPAGREGLRQAFARSWGVDRLAALPGALPPGPGRATAGHLEALGVPTYLDARERREFLIWRGAWNEMRTIADSVAKVRYAGLERKWLVRAVGDLDVSTGETTQRMQFQLVQTIRAADGLTHDSTRVVYADPLQEQMRAFATKLQEKALNHCVDAREPAAGLP
jgi:uncharacterized protein YjbI with pentapeptide repeats